MSLGTDGSPDLEAAEPEYQLGFARLVTHYWSQASFLGETQLLDDAHQIRDIPGTIVQGKLDVSTPIEMAWRLSREWEGSDLIVIDGGHTSPSLGPAFSDALDRLAALVSD